MSHAGSALFHCPGNVHAKFAADEFRQGVAVPAVRVMAIKVVKKDHRDHRQRGGEQPHDDEGP